MMGKWYTSSVENWHKLIDFLEAYEDDIEDIYISSRASEILDKLKEVAVS